MKSDLERKKIESTIDVNIMALDLVPHRIMNHVKFSVSIFLSFILSFIALFLKIDT